MNLYKFLILLDKIAIININKNYSKWFKKKYYKKTLDNAYISTYKIENSNIFINPLIINKNLLKKINTLHYCVLEIDSLIFYKNHFKYSFTINEIINVEKKNNISNHLINSHKYFNDAILYKNLFNSYIKNYKKDSPNNNKNILSSIISGKKAFDNAYKYKVKAKSLLL